MVRSASVPRLGALTLALLAVLGMLLRPPQAPASLTAASFASLAVPLCHAGATTPRDPDGPPSDRPHTGCDTCLLCSVANGDQASLLVPASTALAHISVAGCEPPKPAAPPRLSGSGFPRPWPRAPPVIV